MRNLVLLLVLVNLGVLVFFQWFAERPMPRPPYRGPGIDLLREVDPETTNLARLSERAGGEPVSAAPVAAAAGSERASLARCTSVGPYLEPAEADTATATLIASGFDPRRRTSVAQVWQGYQVYVDRAGAQAPAGDIAASLRRDGFDATPVVANSAGRALISLGVFGDIASAGAEAERAGELGYEVTIADSMISAETFWLDVALDDQDRIDLELLRTPGTISRLEQQPCP